LIFTCALACARYACGCTHMRACVCSHIFGRISSNIGENIYARSHILGQTLSKLLRVTESCMGYLIFTCALACARYACGCTHMRACVCSHIFGRISSNIGENIYARSHILGQTLSKLLRVTESCMGLLGFYVRACVYTLCACVHTHARMCAFAHFWVYSFQIWWRHSSA
jgi:hypothetical protein